MDALLEMADRFKSIDIDSMIMGELRKLEPFIVDLNQRQLQEGKNAEGSNMPRYKNKAYARKKGIDYWNLEKDGFLYSRMYAKFRGDYMIMGSDDPIAEEIDKHPDSDNFYGVNEEHKEITSTELRNNLRPVLKNALR